MRRKENHRPLSWEEAPTQEAAQSPDHWTGFLLHRVAAIARELYETRLAQLGLRPSHVGILQLLATQGPMVQAHLAERLGVDKAAMVAHLNAMENAHLVERRNHPDDGRAFVIHLRQEGSERLTRLEAINQQCTEDLFKGLSSEEQKTLHVLLRRIYDAHF